MSGRCPAEPNRGSPDWTLLLSLAVCTVILAGSAGYHRSGLSPRPVEWAQLPRHGAGIKGAHAVYLYSPYCSACAEANEAAASLARNRPDIRLVAYDLSDVARWREAQGIQTSLAHSYRMREAAAAQIPPGLFVPGRWFVGDKAVAAALRALESAEGSRLRVFSPESGAGRQTALPAAGRLGAVALAGLADGVNPCALTGLAFLLAYLLHVGSTRRAAAVAGTLFAAGTFAAYLAAGLGLYFAVASSSALPAGRLIIYATATVGCIVFALASWSSLGTGAPSTGVPLWGRRTEHRLVHRLTRLGLTWLGAPIFGICFAALELACTGQLYLPAIALLSREGNWQAALRGLLVYNACFAVAPLVLTAAVVAMGRGVTSSRFARWAELGRAATAVALTLLSVLMVEEVYRAACTL